MKIYLLCILFIMTVLNGKIYTVYVNSHFNEAVSFKRWTPTIEYLNGKIPNHTFKLLPIKPNDVKKIKNLLNDKKIDFIITQPAIYSELKYSNRINRILTMTNKFGMNKFGSVMITHKDSNIKNISDIKDKNIAAVAPLGFGGWLIAYKEMYDRGIDPLKDKKVYFTGSQAKVVNLIVNKKYDVGVIRTGMLESMSKSHSVDISNIKIINEVASDYPIKLSSKLYPEWAFAIAGHVKDDKLKSDVFKAMVAITKGSRAAVMGQYQNWSLAQNYGDVEDLLKKFKLSYYKDMKEYTTHDILEVAISIFILAVIILIYIKYKMSLQMQRKLEEEVDNKTSEVKHINDDLHHEVDSQLKELREKDMLLMEQSKLAQMGEMLNMIAHQWRQPLNAISVSGMDLSIANQLGELSKQSIDEHCFFLDGQAQNMSKTIQDLMEFNRPEKNSSFSLYKATAEVTKIISSQLKNKSITLEVNIEHDIKVFHNLKNIEHVLLNLIMNARDAFEEQNIETKIIKIFTTTDEDSVILTIEDNAGGISDNIINKVFNPYFTTKVQGKGTGIGLYMSKQMLESVDGSSIGVEVINEHTLFRVKFVKGE